MITVKIDRNTIKKNPNAGSTQTIVLGHITATFEIEGDLPNGITESDVLIQSESFSSTSVKTLEGILLNIDKADLFAQKGSVSINQEHRTLNHLPEPEYFYEYENPEIPCNYCGSL